MHISDKLRTISWLYCGFALIQSLLFLWTREFSSLAFTSLLFLVVFLNGAYLCRQTPAAAAYLLAICLLVQAVGLNLLTGGAQPGSLFLFFMVPLFAFFLPGKKVKPAYMGLTTLALAALCFFMIFPGTATDRPQGAFMPWDALNILLVFVFFAGVMFFFLKWQKENESRLTESETERKRISENAQHALRIKDEFLANMSHEIRNPMNGIIGMMHVLLDSDLDEEQKRYSKIVYNSARALLTIVNDILDLSKIESGKLELDIRDFDLDVSIKDMVSLPELQARQKGIDFSCQIDADVPCRLKGDIGRIRQIINNLTGNAIKFTDSGEVNLMIGLESEDKEGAVISFRVEDTGIGIKEASLEGLFTSFTQADLSITKKYGGTGLGLAISKLLVEKMGGRIGAESIEMIGSTFWFELPLKKQQDKEKTFDQVAPDITDCKVLVMSDGSSLGLNFEKNLQELEIDYDQAFDETEAMEMLKWAKDDQDSFQLVIMEAKEFDISAEILGKKIRDDGFLGHTKMMLLTSVGKKGDAKRFERIGFSAFLSKPVEKALLKDCIKAVLARPFEGPEEMPIITRYSIIENKKYSRRILIVEDMETNRLTARILLSKLGYKTDEAGNGLEAVQKYKESAYDLILMDCQMPVMDGYEATRQIREEESRRKRVAVPIIAMTGNAFESDREKCFESGMDDFLAKPVDPEILSQKIRSNLTGGTMMETAALSDDVFPDTSGDTLLEDIFHADTINADTVHDASSDFSGDETKPPADEAGVCFDREKLFERFGGDPELVKVVLESFFIEVPELIERIEAVISQKEFEEIRANAHALKGSAANVNAEILRATALDLEIDAKSETADFFDERLKSIHKEFERFSREAVL